MLSEKNMAATLMAAVVIGIAVLYLKLIGGGVQYASALLSGGAAVIIWINWQAHGGGRNASFLFLILGYLFLCGRAIPAVFGGESQLSKISFGVPFDVHPDVVVEYVELLLASFFCVHIGSLIPAKFEKHIPPQNYSAKVYWFIFVALLPLYLYKNIYYFNYIISHGGYLAIYQGAEHLDAVGTIPRVGALLCLAAFILYFFHESDRRKAGFALIAFLVVFSSELIIGLRGKFFVVSLVLFLFYKIRFGGVFSIRGMLTLCISVIGLALIVEMAREQKAESTVGTSILFGFLSQQGVTAGVTEYILQDPVYFSKHAWSYFWHQFLVPFYAQPEVPAGYFLGNDISMQVMPEAYALGFGAGSSYLAELMLLGGVFGVCAGSLLIGWLLSAINRFSYGIRGALFFWVASGIVYYPRTMLHDPVHNLLRYAIPTLLLAVLCWLIQRWVHVNFDAKQRLSI